MCRQGRTAKRALFIACSTPSSPQCALSVLQAAALKHWVTGWKDRGSNTHLSRVVADISEWRPSTRKKRYADSLYRRLRLGWAPLNQYHCRIRRKDSPECTMCNTPESVCHFLLVCCRYTAQRNTLKAELGRLVVPFSLCNLLGGAEPHIATREQIQDLVLRFAAETRRFSGTWTY